jgi:hypothetical protein
MTRHRYWAPSAPKSASKSSSKNGFTAVLASASAPLVAANESSSSKADAWRAEIEALKSNKVFEEV